MIKALRSLLFPFSWLYGPVVSVRNYLYDKQYLRSVWFGIPVISVGNLAVGGAGKSPMTEYLAALLKDRYKMAILSRGYGRSTRGFLIVGQDSTAEEVGDEPLQFKHKFPDLTVAVSEKRGAGIEKLKAANDVVILDDAYQHRSVKAGLSILLFDYTTLFSPQRLLPAGDLREPLSQRRRADIIVVTKTPENIDSTEKKRISERVRPFPEQQLFFSYLEYKGLVPVYGKDTMALSAISAEHSIFLLTGIANPGPLIERLKQTSDKIIHHRYPDHHAYSIKNIAKLAKSFLQADTVQKLIITTEKDAQRLRLPGIQELLAGLPVYYLPVAARMHSEGEAKFNHIIESYVAR